MDNRQAVQDTVVPGLTQQERQQIKQLAKRVQHIFVADDSNPDVAFTALLNVLGSLIGTALVDDAAGYIAKAQAYLPMYAEAYRVREKVL